MQVFSFFMCCVIILQAKYWENKDPVVYSEWRNMNISAVYKYGLKKLKTGMCKTNQAMTSFPLCESLCEISHTCTALFLVNPAKPQWVSIACEKNTMGFAFCRIPATNEQTRIEPSPESVYCLGHNVLLNESCFQFNWLHSVKVGVCRSDTKKFQHLFWGTSNTKFLPVFVNNSVLTFRRLFDKIYFERLQNASLGFCIQKSKVTTFDLGLNIYKCTTGAIVLAIYQCDGFKDCGEEQPTDEMSCACKSNKDLLEGICQKQPKANGKVQCSPLYFMSIKGICLSFVFRTKNIPSQKSLIVAQNMLIQFQKGGTSDNNVVRARKKESTSSQQLFSLSYCKQEYQLPCSEQSLTCYNVTQICQYTVLNGVQIPCTEGDHLQHCNDFQCNSRFKCPDHYCILWNQVCDGIWHCPQGSDEADLHRCGPARPCQGLYKCRQQSICIHSTSVCDKKEDCLFCDDEDMGMCSLQNVRCPLACRCLTFAVMCISQNFTAEGFDSFGIFKSVYIHSSNFQDFAKFQFGDLLGLTITQSHFTKLCDLMNSVKKLIFLNIEENSVSELQAGCFKFTKALSLMKLNENHINIILAQVFKPMHKLKILNISGNPIVRILPGAFDQASCLRVVSLLHTETTEIPNTLFQNVPLEYIETSDFKFCCLKEIQCSTELPWHFDCTDLLIHTGIKVTFYIVSCAIIILNILSCFLQYLSHTKGFETIPANACLLVSVNVSDILYSFPLFVLWIADLTYEGIYFLFEHKWRSSAFCYITYGLFLNFSVLSPMTLCLLFYSRLMIVEHPVDSDFKETDFVLRRIGFTFLGVVLYSIICTAVTAIMNFYVLHVSFSGLCSPFVHQQTVKSFTLSHIWTALAVFVLIFSTTFILVVYSKLLTSLSDTQEQIKSSASESKNKSFRRLVCQLVIVVVTNILCWLPSCAAFLFSLFYEKDPDEIMFWTTIVITPVNSLVNPAVFSFMTLRKIVKKATTV